MRVLPETSIVKTLPPYFFLSSVSLSVQISFVPNANLIFDKSSIIRPSGLMCGMFECSPEISA